MLFRRISLYFMTGFCVFWGKWFTWRLFSKPNNIFIALGMWDCSSVVEHSAADREVGGSIPLDPFSIIMGYLSKDF